MERTRQFMTREEVERMGERQTAIERDRYKSDEVVKMREQELMDEFREIKKRVEKRVPLMEAEKKRGEEQMREVSAILDDPEAEEEDKGRAMRKLLHDPFKDLDEFLTDGEMHELNDLKARPVDTDPMVMSKLQNLLTKATERRIERQIDELLDREDDVLV